MISIIVRHPGGSEFDSVTENVAGHLIFAVVRNPETAELKVETYVGVNCSNKEDYDVVFPFIKQIEDKLKEILPQPEFVEYPETPEPKLWVPNS